MNSPLLTYTLKVGQPLRVNAQVKYITLIACYILTAAAQSVQANITIETNSGKTPIVPGMTIQIDGAELNVFSDAGFDFQIVFFGSDFLSTIPQNRSKFTTSDDLTIAHSGIGKKTSFPGFLQVGTVVYRRVEVQISNDEAAGGETIYVGASQNAGINPGGGNVQRGIPVIPQAPPIVLRHDDLVWFSNPAANVNVLIYQTWESIP